MDRICENLLSLTKNRIMQHLLRKFLVGIMNKSDFPEKVKRQDPKQTICLNMIVKNESHVIERCLKSVKPLIDYWVIVDTGSTDGTQEAIKKFMKGIPGELYERPWVDFAHNRNEAFTLAKNKADYIFIIDADHVVEYSKDFLLPHLDKDFYFVVHDLDGLFYKKEQLVNSKLQWVWQGVIHEGISCKVVSTWETLEGVRIVDYTDGHRSKNPHKLLDDAKVLREALKNE